MSSSTSIRALALEGFDAPPAVIDVPAPEPGAGEVLVRVRAAGVNPYDTFVASGGMKDYVPYRFPAVLGTDVAGVIEALGDGVEGFAIGDRVFGKLGDKPEVHDGTFGTLAVPSATSLSNTPAGVDDLHAATLGVAGTTAMSALEALDLQPGGSVLVAGATGGVGTFAIQLAANRGATVVASVRPGDEGFVADLGAKETVDYTGDLAAAVRERFPDGVDALIDLVNRDPSAFASSVGLVREGGHAASAVGGAGERTEIDGVSVANVGGDPQYLGALADLVAAGALRPAIRRTYPLEDAAQALSDLTSEHTLGKLVIAMA